MREYENKIVKKEVEFQTSVGCNKCGRVDDLNPDAVTGTDIMSNETKRNIYSNFNISFGYGSKFDLEIWSFDLCEDCLEEFVQTFKVVPEKSGRVAF